MKISKSCRQCREGKRRCTAEEAGKSCQHCLRRNKSCSLAEQKQKQEPQRTILPNFVNDGDLNSLEVPGLTDDARDQLVDLYLSCIHDKPHTLFHPASLKERVRNGSLPMAVLYGIMALAARLSDEEAVRQKAGIFFLKAKHLLKVNIDVPCLDNIHASILVGNLCGAEAQSATEGIFFGIAFRMAHILHLPESNAIEDSITQEIKIRTWWSLYMIDQWSSAGLNLPRQLHDHQHRLPMAETEFWSLKPGQKIESVSHPRPSLWGHMVILARIFGPIQDLHQKLANGLLEEGTAETITQELAQKFEQFVQDLPPTLHFTCHNLRQHAKMGLGRAFVALHLGYHHYATLLYFPYFDAKSSPNINRTRFVARCKYHATSFSDLLRSSQETPDCEAVYLIVAHMTVVSSSALLYILLFGDETELLEARKRLFSNFGTLLKLKQYWPGVDLMMERLFTFQKVCMRTMDKTYTVDRWIVKFLLQHALPIEGEIGQPATADLEERGKFASDALSMLRPEI